LGGSQMNGAKSEGTGRDVVAPALLGPLLELACMDNRCGAAAATLCGCICLAARATHAATSTTLSTLSA
jgi:hypothetical protein